MYSSKTVAVVVPAYNEESLIGRVLKTMPDCVDYIIVIDDASRDKTSEIVIGYKKSLGERLKLIRHAKNQGVGGAIVSGYKWALDNGVDITAVMAGDAQMDAKELPSILEPIAKDEADYAKGNRLSTGQAWKLFPKVRYIGNSFLSLLTKVASGYWQIADSQCGYTAISHKALKGINLKNLHKRYGVPNDILIKLNIYRYRVKDVPVLPIYNIGERSGIRLWRVIPAISFLLLRGFIKRLVIKYIIIDFHPLVFFYLFGGVFGIATVLLFIRLFYVWITIGSIPSINAFAAMFSFISSCLFILFAMWFDMEQNKDLGKR